MGRDSLLRPEEFEIVEVGAGWPFAEARVGTWPCPLCGERQPVDGARRVRISNLQPPRLEREVVICSGCLLDASR